MLNDPPKGEVTATGMAEVLRPANGNAQGARAAGAGFDQRGEIEDWFTYHKPTPDQLPKYQALRDKAKELALLAHDVVPSGADRSAGFRLLREAIMTFNAAIAIAGSREARQLEAPAGGPSSPWPPAPEQMVGR